MLKRLLLVLAGCAVALAAAEMYCRVRWTKPWFDRLLEQQMGGDWKWGLRPNRLGLRDRDYDEAKPARTRRLLILGDSFTYGNGVADTRAIFPEILERELDREAAAAGGTIEVLNAGQPGSLTGDWVRSLRRLRKEFDPDAVLVVFFLRDATLTSSMGAFFAPARYLAWAGNRRTWLYRHSYLVRTIQDSRFRRELLARYGRALNESYFGNAEQTAEWAAAQSNLLEIARLGRESGFQVGLAVFPALIELNQDYPFRAISDAVAAFGRTNGIPTHDLLPSFLGQNAPDLWVSSFDQHPNEIGHRIAADSLKPFARELLGLRKAGTVK